MGDVSAEPTMEEILSSIKRVIEESEATPARVRKPARTNSPRDAAEEVLELNERIAFPESIVRDDIDDEPIATPVPTPPAAVATPRAEPILSATAAEASRGPLEALSRMIVKPDVAGADTLEGLVREMLRPMLREWLDTNLPSVVEAMVAKEIARISDRGA